MSKRKILALALTVAMIAILAVGGSLAYFSEKETVTNVFSAGNVGITLTESVVEKNEADNYVATNDVITDGEQQEYDLHPGQTITKNPTITVDEGSMDAYVAAKITVEVDDAEELMKLLSTTGHQPYIDITKLVSGGITVPGAKYIGNWQGEKEVFETDVVMTYQKPDVENNKWVIYVLVKAPVAANGKVELFNTITIPTDYNNAEMAALDGLTITVDAFATQIDGFTQYGETDGVGCYEAMKAAFAGEF